MLQTEIKCYEEQNTIFPLIGGPLFVSENLTSEVHTTEEDTRLVVWNMSSKQFFALDRQKWRTGRSFLFTNNFSTATAHQQGRRRMGQKQEQLAKTWHIFNGLRKNNLPQTYIHLPWIKYSFWNDIRPHLLYLPLCSHLPFSGSKLCALVRKWANACLYLAGYMPWIYSLLQEVIGNYSGHLGNHCLFEIHVILKNN